MGQSADPLRVAYSGTAGHILTATPAFLTPRYFSDHNPVHLIPRHLDPLVLAISQFEHPRYLLLGVPRGATERLVHSLVVEVLRQQRNSVQLVPADRPFYYWRDPCEQSDQKMCDLLPTDAAFVPPYDHVLYVGEDMLDIKSLQSCVILDIAPLPAPPPRFRPAPAPAGGGAPPPPPLRGRTPVPREPGDPVPENAMDPPADADLGVGQGEFANPPRPRSQSVAAGQPGPLPGTGLAEGTAGDGRGSLITERERLQQGGWALAMLPRNRQTTHASVYSTVFWSTVHKLTSPGQKMRLFMTDTAHHIQGVCKIHTPSRRPLSRRQEITNTGTVGFLPNGNIGFDNVLQVEIEVNDEAR